MKEKPEQTAKRLAKTRGYTYPEWEYLAEKDPVFLEAYNRLSGLSLLHEGVPTKGKKLPAKYRELVAIAAMIGQSRMWGVKAHMERALRVGCTEQELLEALETALTPVGSPPFRQAINILMQVTGWQPAAARKTAKKRGRQSAGRAT